MRHGSTRGRLLVATPPLVDPSFDRTVVLVLDHDEEGALGVVINRPTPEDEVPGLDRWLETATPPGVVFAGGPVETDTLIGLATLTDAGGSGADRDHPSAARSGGWSVVSGTLGSVDLDGEPSEVADRLAGLRIFRGYAGWGPGQLDDELEAGAWIVVEGRVEDPFSDSPDDLWRTVLHRQGGRLAWLALLCPDDLSLN